MNKGINDFKFVTEVDMSSVKSVAQTTEKHNYFNRL